MRKASTLLGALIGIAGLSCNTTTPPPPSAADGMSQPLASAEPPAAGQVRQAAPIPGPTIPKDARFTIFCGTVSGAEHAARARVLRDDLIRSTQLRDWYIVQGSQETTLYYGFYKEIHESADKRESARAHGDRKKLAGMNDVNGQRLFGGVFLISLDTGDPTAPAEWNLLNVPRNRYYSLQVGVYKDDPKRKAAAVQAVREARAQGAEAYFYHGPTASSVCVGAWPAEAVSNEQEIETWKKIDRNDHVMVLPALPNLREETLTAPDGSKVQIRKPKGEILDPTLRSTWQKYPVHGVNGIIKGSSVLVVIPGRDRAATPAQAELPSGIGGYNEIPAARNPAAAPPPTSGTGPGWQPPPSKQPLGGKLRSVED